jgi:P-type Mg2+ transporter
MVAPDQGLTSEEAARRLAAVGPNAPRVHGVRPVRILLRQFNNPLLLLLGATAVASILFGERTDALIILVISAMSVGLGFIKRLRVSTRVFVARQLRFATASPSASMWPRLCLAI